MLIFVLYGLVGLTLGVVVWKAPALLKGWETRQLAFAAASRQFYRAANPVIKDPQTPERLVAFLGTLSANIDNPRLSRQLLWKLLDGRLREHAAHPTNYAQAFNFDLEGLPEELSARFLDAAVAGISANALGLPFVGQVVLRILVPHPRPTQEAVERLGPEVGLAA